MKRFIVLMLISAFSLVSVTSSQSFKGKKNSTISKTSKIKSPQKSSTTRSKKGVISKIGDAATRGYGWGLGREAAKETVKGVKKLYQSATNKGDGTKK